MIKHYVDVLECTGFFLARILNLARRIHFFVLCNEELNYKNYIEKCIGDKECSVCFKSHTGHFFQISYQNETILILFEVRLFPKLPSELMFAQSVLKKNTVGIVTVKGRVACITNEAISSRHDCVFKAYFCEFDSLIKLANCKAYTQYCPLHRDDTCLYQILYSSQKSRRISAYTKCHCKLCAKDEPASLKYVCKQVTRK